MRRALLAGLLAAPLLAACAGGTTQTVRSGDGGASDGAVRAPSIQVRYAGGFVQPAGRFGEIPLVTVYGDGRVFVPGPQSEIYPPPALPNVQVGRVSEQRVRELVDEAVAAGVDGRPHDYGQPPVADAPATVFTVLRDGRTSTVSVEALREAQGAGLTPAQQRARGQLVTLVEHLSAAATGTSAYDFDALAVLAQPYGDVDPAQQPQPGTATWRGPDPATGTELVGGRCLVLRGTDLAAVQADVQQANTNTQWTSGGTTWLLAFRPLLPDERSCDDVIAGPPQAEEGTPTGR